MVMGLSNSAKTEDAEKRSSVARKILSIMAEELSSCEREAVARHILDGETFAKIAADTGRNKSTVFRNYNRGLGKIQKFARYMDLRR